MAKLFDLLGCAMLLVCSFGAASAQDPAGTDGPLTLVGKPLTPRQAAAADPKALSNDVILRMSRAGIGDDLLIQTIQLQPGHYDTSVDALIELKHAGVSDRVLSAMQAQGTGLALRPAHPPVRAAAAADGSSMPENSEPGVYYKDAHGNWMLMESERVHIQSGGFIKSTLTHNIIKEDRNGVVSGREAKLLLERPIDFMIYTPEGVSGTEYDLLRFRLNSKNREFRTLTGGVIHSTGGAQRDELPFAPVRTAPHIWVFSVGKDTPGGEYGILPPGTGNVTDGGKIYTFAISE